jgi:hypothetical protein
LGDAATIPNALPFAVNALTRNSGWDQVMATLVFRLAFQITPISPSGATIGSNPLTPWAVPTFSNSMRESVICA